MTEMKSRDERDEIVRDVRDILTNMNDKGSDNIKRADHKMSKVKVLSSMMKKCF